MDAAQAEDSSDVIMGNLPVNDIPARVLFDTGASHCFMLKPFFTKHEFFLLIWVNIWILSLLANV